MQIIYCEPTEAEKDFYEALFKRSKVFLFIFNILYLLGTEKGHILTLNQPVDEIYAGKV